MPPHAPGRPRFPVPDQGVLVGLGVLALLIGCDLVFPSLLTATYAASAMVASMLTSARRTAFVAVVAVVMAFVVGYLRTATGIGLTIHPGSGTNEMEWVLRASLGLALGTLAVVSAVVRDRREERLRRMTLIAATAQQALLSSLPSSIGDLRMASRYLSATSEALVGGDLYEVAPTPWGVRVIVGDVKGKGIEAVQVAAAVLSAFRHTAGDEPDLSEVARRLDVAIRPLLSEEDFVTALIAEFDGDRVTLANCGHPAPVLITDATTRALEPEDVTVPLGLGANPLLSIHDWPADGRLLLHTDGLSEARGHQGLFFPLDDVADGLSRGSLDEALDELVDSLVRHADEGIGDDLAIVLIEPATRVRS